MAPRVDTSVAVVNRWWRPASGGDPPVVRAEPVVVHPDQLRGRSPMYNMAVTLRLRVILMSRHWVRLVDGWAAMRACARSLSPPRGAATGGASARAGRGGLGCRRCHRLASSEKVTEAVESAAAHRFDLAAEIPFAGNLSALAETNTQWSGHAPLPATAAQSPRWCVIRCGLMRPATPAKPRPGPNCR